MIIAIADNIGMIYNGPEPTELDTWLHQYACEYAEEILVSGRYLALKYDLMNSVTKHFDKTGLFLQPI